MLLVELSVAHVEIAEGSFLFGIFGSRDVE
jgi:hypothetical protein